MDWLLLLLLAAFAVNGLMQGVVRQAAGFGGVLIGLLVASWLYLPFASRIVAVLPAGWSAEAVAYASLLLMVWVLFTFLGTISRQKVTRDESDWADDAGGAVVGLLSGVVLLSVLCSGLASLSTPIAHRVQGSLIGQWLLAIAAYGAGVLV